MALVRRARKINRILAETYPDAECELDFDTPFQLLVAVVLSAQCTDVRVNLTTPALFAKYPDPASMAAADRIELEDLIRPTGFYRNKATSLLGLAVGLCDRYGGEVPKTLEQLVTLPGVGRKTANVVLGNARDPKTGEPFDVPGLTVDTHFGRLVRRFGWTAEEDPVRVERVIGELFPKAEWTLLSHRLIFHGRRVCHSRRPACGACPVAALCPSRTTGETDPVKAEAMLRPASAREAAQLAAANAASRAQRQSAKAAKAPGRSAASATSPAAATVAETNTGSTADGPPPGPESTVTRR